MATYQNAVKQPGNLSPRVKRLRDYYFEGTSRKWNNEYSAYTTGTPWDIQFDEMTYYIVPEMYSFLCTFTASIRQAAEIIEVEKDFWKKSLPERKALFTRKAVAERLPAEILPGDLLCGARFNLMTSMCLTKKEQEKRNRLLKAARKNMRFIYDHGYGNGGATSGHLIPDYAKILKHGFKEEYRLLEERYAQLSEKEKNSEKGEQLRAMMIACAMPKELAEKYSRLCQALAEKESDETRKKELETMAANTSKVPCPSSR